MGFVAALIVFFVVVGVIGYAVGLYNGLITVRNNVDKAWANIDVVLKQRHDELPKLIETCRGYMKYEQALLEKVTQARTAFMSATSIEAKTQAENELSRGLKSLFAVAENYPDLKANQSFLQLQGRISSIENMIADRREFFNESVNVYNIKIEQFPDLIVARALNYAKRPLLEIPESDKQDVKISF